MHAIFLSVFCFCTYCECFFDVVTNKQKSLSIVLGVTLTWFMMFSTSGIIGAFTFFHLTQLAGKGRTTIEFCEGNDSGEYNTGFCSNILVALGKNPLLWIFPFGINKEGNGLDFVVVENYKKESFKENSAKDETTVLQTEESAYYEKEESIQEVNDVEQNRNTT